MKPLVSIGLPVFNGEKLIAEAVTSLLAQEMPDFELIISDNASTDNTLKICEELQKKDNRILIYRNEKNVGSVRNFDFVAKMATGKYFMWASHDDLWSSEYIKKCLIPLESNKNIVMVYTHNSCIQPDGVKIIEKTDISTVGMTSAAERVKKLHRNAGRRTAYYGLSRTEAVQSTLPGSRTLSHDHVFLSQMAVLGQFACVPEPLFTYRMQSHLSKSSEQIRGFYQQMIAPDTRWAGKFQTLWPVGLGICARITKNKIPLKDKLSIYWSTLGWTLHHSYADPEKNKIYAALLFVRRKFKKLIHSA